MEKVYCSDCVYCHGSGGVCFCENVDDLVFEWQSCEFGVKRVEVARNNKKDGNEYGNH